MNLGLKSRDGVKKDEGQEIISAKSCGGTSGVNFRVSEMLRSV